jgi:glycosyltransferase involved in cell wall biosynthesis
MNNKKKTLVILTPGFPDSEADTTCLPMQQQFARSLKELYPSLNTIILSFQYPYHSKTYKWFDATVISFNGRNKGGLSKLRLRQKINNSLKKIHNENRIIGLLSFWYNECAWIGKKFGEKNSIKHYCWLLGQDAKKENKYPKRLKPSASELIALSDFLQDEFEKNHGTRPFTVIPPGIEAKQVDNSMKEKNIDLLAAGSLIPLKQYEIFIEIIAEIKKQLPHIKAMLVGDGPEREKLQDLVANLGLKENISLPGELPHYEVLQLMERTKVFLHPSSYEGFGVVCIEALYAATHVISFVKPMKKEIANWQISNTKEEMVQKTLANLQNPDIVYQRTLPFTMNATVEMMMELFNA